MAPRPAAMSWNLPILIVLALGLLAADRPGGFAPKPKAAGDLPLALRVDFERSDLDAWEFTDPDAWRITEQDGNHVLEQHRASKYEPPVRSPFNIALARRVDVGDLVIDVKVRSTGRDYGHRDLCFIFKTRTRATSITSTSASRLTPTPTVSSS